MNEGKHEIITSAQATPISYVLTCVHGTDCPHLCPIYHSTFSSFFLAGWCRWQP